MVTPIASGFTSPRDLLEKLRRDSEKLKSEVNKDNLFNFVVTAWHLGRDWIKRSAIPLPAMEAERVKMMSEPEMKICGDIANATKHSARDRNAITTNLIHHPPATFGQAVFGLSHFGDGRGTYTLVVGSTNYDLDLWRERVLELYEDFFQKHGL
jgi:hypothetical protein